MARLIDAVEKAMKDNAPKTLKGAASRFKWDNKAIAQKMGVTVRTVQRWQKAGKIPDARRPALAKVVQDEQVRRAWNRAASKGLKQLGVAGQYQVSNYRPQYARGKSFRAPNGIPAADMREAKRLRDEGRTADAEAALSNSLAQHYGINAPVSWQNVEDVDVSLR